MSWSTKAYSFALRRALHRCGPHLTELASESWIICPQETRHELPSFFLPGQFERIQGYSEFAMGAERERARLAGGYVVPHGATRGYRIRDVVLMDGTLFKNGSAHVLHPRTRSLPNLRVEKEIDRASIYCSFPGNAYFAHWLMDDCVTYPLAMESGNPVATRWPAATVQMAQYARLLEIRSERLESAFFRELVMFHDIGHNQSKRRRFSAMTDRLRGGSAAAEGHPGVFILRGNTGSRRRLLNELQLAEHLRDTRGLRIVDPMKLSAQDIMSTCANSQSVVSVEGSHLLNGLLMLRPGGSLLVLQPPKRYSSVYKDLTDRDGQKYGFVVGAVDGGSDDFTIAVDEVEKTLDLMA
jgi:hypothetical protein